MRAAKQASSLPCCKRGGSQGGRERRAEGPERTPPSSLSGRVRQHGASLSEPSLAGPALENQRGLNPRCALGPAAHSVRSAARSQPTKRRVTRLILKGGEVR